MIASRIAAPLLLALLSLAGCAETAQSGLTDTARINPARTSPPQYPAGHEGEPGSAKMACTITPTGATEACRCITSTSDVFCKAGLDFITHAHFLPAMKNGVAVSELNRLYTVNFKPGPPGLTKPIMLSNPSLRLDFSALPDAEFKARSYGDPPRVAINVKVHCMVLPSGLPKDCSAQSNWPAMTAIMLRFINLSRYKPGASDGIPITASWDTTLHVLMDPADTPAHPKP